MKNNTKLILLALFLVVLLVAAVFLYGKLRDSYQNDVLTEDEHGESAADTQLAPDFTVYDTDGNPVRLSDFRGKPVVINFWATWCYYCKEEMPDFDAVAKVYPEVQFLMVNATDGQRETVEKAKAYVKEEGFSFPVVFDIDREAVSTYYVTGFPTTYFIGSDGTVVTGAAGMIDRATLEKGISMIVK